MTRWHLYLLGLAFGLLPLGIILYKHFALGYGLDQVVPWRGYRVRMDLTFDGHGDSLHVRTFLPAADLRQHVWHEQVDGLGVGSQVESDSQGNHILRLVAGGAMRSYVVSAAYQVLPEHVRYSIDSGLTLAAASGGAAAEHLLSTEKVQVSDTAVGALRRTLAGKEIRALPLLLRFFEYVTDSLRYTAFSGETDALTALRLGEASCNGKSRLLVALLRGAGLPSRLVGGLILERGVKRTSHQWVEAWVSGHWVPFCPTNGHFAEIPDNYLALYRGDEALFRHSPNINFTYMFHLDPILVSKDEVGAQGARLGGLFRLGAVFQEAGLGFPLLKYLLLLPVGGLITVLFRNVIGMAPFGTFLPALMAAASHRTGILWGIAAFYIVVFVCVGAHFLLERLQIARTPKLAILMTAVVACILMLTYAGILLEIPQLAFVSLFPVVVLTMTAERLARALADDGLAPALGRTGATAVAMACCFGVMEIKALQLFLMTFPEALLFLCGLNVWIGRWAGVRVMEYWRFRHYLLAPARKTV